MPGEPPVITPEDEPIVATVVLLLLQLPPDVELLRVTLELVQITSVPVIAPGLGFIVTTRVPDDVQYKLLRLAVYVIGVGAVIPVGWTYTGLSAVPE